MRLSSVFMICSGLANIGLASIFYYYAFISYSSAAGNLVIIGLMFTVIGLSSFQILGRLGKKTRAFLGVALLVIAVIELGFSFLFLSFAYDGRYMSLLEVGIPLLLASTFSFASTIQEYRETKRKRANYVKIRPKTQSTWTFEVLSFVLTLKAIHINVTEKELLDVNSWTVWLS